jgi:hypothetical protein
LIEPTLIQPTFVTHLPKELVPLAKLSPDDPTTVEVFECCINGQEIFPGLHRAVFPRRNHVDSTEGDGYISAMTTEAIKTAVQQRPFRPFSVRLADGSEIQIQSQDNVAVHPTGKTFVIFEPDGGYRIVDIPLVTDMSVH